MPRRTHMAVLAAVIFAYSLDAQAPSQRTPQPLAQFSPSIQDLARASSPAAVQISVRGRAPLEVLKIEPKGFPKLPFPDGSRALTLGQLVFAPGSPLGLENSLMVGFVSAPVRRLSPDGSNPYAQTGEPIGPGSGGGPLLDIAGHMAAKRSVPATMRADTSLVLIPVGVTDRLNRPVTRLDKSSFRVFDSNVEQQVLSLTFEDAPLAVGLVFDTSASMDRKMAESRAAVVQFLRTANAEDEFFLVEFNDRVNLTQPLTADAADILARLGHTAHGHTALLDAIALSLGELRKSSKPRKALVIFSDGGDNRSRYTKTEVRGMACESDALIYAMGIIGMEGVSLRPEEVTGPGLLSEITEASGGRMFPVGDLNDLPDIAQRIGVDLHNEYVLGYSPTNLRSDGKYHKVRVKVAPPPGLSFLHVDGRAGYRAPLQ